MKPEFRSPQPARTESGVRTVEAAAIESEALRKELVEQEVRNLRLAADLENVRRRSRQDGEARAAAQKESFIHELLPVLDNLERALASGASPGCLEFHQGVAMTLQQLRQLLRQHGIETEESVGQAFDPRRQEAVAQRCDPAHADNAILEVFQRGYRRGEKVFRPAQVVVNNLTLARAANEDH